MGICEKCGKTTNKKVTEYSMTKYNQVLCYDCQKIENIPTEFKDATESAENPKTRQNVISRHGALNTAIEICRLKGEKDTQNLKKYAEMVLKYVNGSG